MRNTTPLCSIKFRRWLSKLCTNYFFPETATQFFSTKDNRLLQAAINLHIVHKIHRTLGRKQSSSYFNIWENSIWRGNKKIMLVYLLLLNYIKSQKKNRKSNESADVESVPVDEHRWILICLICFLHHVLIWLTTVESYCCSTSWMVEWVKCLLTS